ncbi:hypothetical protein GGR51DRAFT_497783 [Nemania sp. FL0031]|nr:hypothetical protein GGR51DRAFT_497783 [Nemania sp. FL0031]
MATTQSGTWKIENSASARIGTRVELAVPIFFSGLLWLELVTREIAIATHIVAYTRQIGTWLSFGVPSLAYTYTSALGGSRIFRM